MPSLDYENVYSKFRLKASAYDLISMNDDDVSVFLCEWLHSSVNKPYIRRLFANITLDDLLQKITFEMKYSIDDNFDKEFIMDIIGIGMVIEWITPKINSLNNIVQVFGSKEEKFYSQSNHLSELRNLKHSLLNEQHSMIKERGYIWNSYLGDNS